MFCVLIVEDNSGTREQLTELLKEAIPGIRIDAASTVEEGQQYLEARQQWPYDAVILDIMLPVSKESRDEKVDYTLCDSAVDRMKSTLVIHITSFAGNAEVEAHIREKHVKEGLVRGFALYKLGKSAQGVVQPNEEFATELVSKLKAGLFGDYIRQETSDLFAAEGATPAAGRSRVMGRSRFEGVSSTHRMVNLIQVISANWGSLHETDQRIVKRYFEVDDSRFPVRVSLLPFNGTTPGGGIS